MYRAVNTFEWCVLHIFSSGIIFKECLWILAYLTFSLLLLCKLDWNHLPERDSILWKAFICSAVSHTPPRVHTHTHQRTQTPSTPNHSRMAFTSAPCRAPPLLERTVWQHLKRHYVPLTCSTVTCRSSWKRLTWPQNPEGHDDQTQSSPDTSWLAFSSLLEIIPVHQLQKVSVCWDNQMGFTCKTQFVCIRLPSQFTRIDVDLMNEDLPILFKRKKRGTWVLRATWVMVTFGTECHTNEFV